MFAGSSMEKLKGDAHYTVRSPVFESLGARFSAVKYWLMELGLPIASFSATYGFGVSIYEQQSETGDPKVAISGGVSEYWRPDPVGSAPLLGLRRARSS